MKIRLLTLSLLLALTGMLLGGPGVQASGARPSDMYKQFLAKVYWAKNIRDFSDYLHQPEREHLNSVYGEERYREFKKWKASYVARFKLIKEEVVDERAFIEGTGLTMSMGKRVNAHVKVEMIRENGAWKIMYTGWSGTVWK